MIADTVTLQSNMNSTPVYTQCIYECTHSEMCIWTSCFFNLKVFACVFPQTSRIEFDLPEYCVRRRYQDFDWLRIKLEESQPTHLIPVGQMSHDAHLRSMLFSISKRSIYRLRSDSPLPSSSQSLFISSRCQRSSWWRAWSIVSRRSLWRRGWKLWTSSWSGLPTTLSSPSTHI